MRYGALILVAGCGRVAFDPLTDASSAAVCLAPSGHDEDGDAVDDTCDVCPHLPDPGQPDADGDGVGDMCDPEPVVARQRIARFEPFTSPPPGWPFGPAVAFDGEAVIIDTLGTSLDVEVPGIAPASDVFSYGGRVTAVAASARQLIISFVNGSPAVYYCEIEGTDPAMKIAVTHTFDGNSYMVDALVPLAPLAPGPFSLTARHVRPDLTCSTTWDGGAEVSSPVPGAIVPTGVAIIFVGIAVELEYFVQIRTE